MARPVNEQTDISATNMSLPEAIYYGREDKRTQARQYYQAFAVAGVLKALGLFPSGLLNVERNICRDTNRIHLSWAVRQSVYRLRIVDLSRKVMRRQA